MELPAKFGRYELLEFLGGGMSHVYRAKDLLLGRIVAVKILKPERASDEESKARFLREAKTAGNTEHENIIHIYDFGEHDGSPYMVMEFLRGQDLRRAIQKQETGSLRDRLGIARGIASALEHIHAASIIHRDIKPDNVHIDHTGKVKLMDFGIAKANDANLTRPGFTLGTPSYMAPEQVRGQAITPAADIYSWGMLLFELITGAKAIRGQSIAEIFQKILVDPVDFTPLEESGAGPQVVDLVQRCVDKDPAVRPPEFGEVIAELDAIIYEMDNGAPLIAAVEESAAEATPARRPVWLIPAVIAGVLLPVLVGVVLFKSNQRPASAPITAPGVEGMVLIPAGVFPYGLSKKPVTLPAYLIDRTEVSNGDYAKFCQAARRPVPVGDPELPVTGITIDDAVAYAAWVGKRLPTPQEWEKAARGTAGNLYPWGDQPQLRNAVVAGNPDLPAPHKVAVDAFPQGASFYGVLNLVGNVREYVREFGTPSQEEVAAFARLLSPAPTAAESWCITRGGSFDQPLPKDGAADAMLVPVRYAAANIGFRCARDVR